jgi:hypothetical protein
MKRNRRDYARLLLADDGNPGAAGAGGGAAAGGTAAAGAAGAGAGDAGAAAGAGAGAAAGGSLLQAGAGAGAAPTGTDWIPEKHRVAKEDGTIDVEASARKVAEAHAALEKRMGSTGLPPAAPDAYVPEGLPADFNYDEVKADPLYQAFAKEAHAAGFNNAQMGVALKAWAERSAAVAGEAVGLTLEAAKAELTTAWGGEANFAPKIQAASEATATIAAKAGISIEQINESGLGRNPTFLRLMESISADFKGDGPTPGGGSAIAAGDFDTQLAEIKAHPGYADAKHPEHAALMARKQALYDRRYPAKGTPPAVTKP